MNCPRCGRALATPTCDACAVGWVRPPPAPVPPSALSRGLLLAGFLILGGVLILPIMPSLFITILAYPILSLGLFLRWFRQSTRPGQDSFEKLLVGIGLPLVFVTCIAKTSILQNLR